MALPAKFPQNQPKHSPPEQAEETADKPTYTHAYGQMREK